MHVKLSLFLSQFLASKFYPKGYKAILVKYLKNDVLEFCMFSRIHNPKFYSASGTGLRKLSVFNSTIFAFFET